MARRRALTPDERQLWNQVVAGAVPLRAADAPPLPDPAKGLPVPADPPRSKTPAEPARRPGSPTLDALAGFEGSHPQMDRRRFEKLRRGRIEPEARLDLHGMTSERAHSMLTAFILSAVARDRRLVLVITGKGKIGSESERGVLRRQVPQWLGLPEFRSLVVGFEEAHIGHGGEGALYVRVRRARF